MTRTRTRAAEAVAAENNVEGYYALFNDRNPTIVTSA
jgi:hypothetical protein